MIFNKRKNEEEIERLKRELVSMTQTTEYVTETTIEKLVQIINEKNIELSRALKTKEGRDIMFQFLLHKHWVAYNAEQLRQLIAASDSTVDISNYSEKIENPVAIREMNFFMVQFIEEYKPFLRETLESEHYKWQIPSGMSK